MPAEDQTPLYPISTSLKSVAKFIWKAHLPLAHLSSVSLLLKRIPVILEMHILRAAVLQQLLQIENK